MTWTSLVRRDLSVYPPWPVRGTSGDGNGLSPMSDASTATLLTSDEIMDVLRGMIDPELSSDERAAFTERARKNAGDNSRPHRHARLQRRSDRCRHLRFSVPRMFGIDGCLDATMDGEGTIIRPHTQAMGPSRLDVVSMGFFVEGEEGALLWRGLRLNRASHSAATLAVRGPRNAGRCRRRARVQMTPPIATDQGGASA